MQPLPPQHKEEWLLGVALSAVLAAIWLKAWIFLLLAIGLTLLYVWFNIIPDKDDD